MCFGCAHPSLRPRVYRLGNTATPDSDAVLNPLFLPNYHHPCLTFISAAVAAHSLFITIVTLVVQLNEQPYSLFCRPNSAAMLTYATHR